MNTGQGIALTIAAAAFLVITIIGIIRRRRKREDRLNQFADDLRTAFDAATRSPLWHWRCSWCPFETSYPDEAMQHINDRKDVTP